VDPYLKLSRTARKLQEEVHDLGPALRKAKMDRAGYLALKTLLREVAALERMLDCLGCGNLARRSKVAADMIEEMLER
jgi:hypothetical protein